MSAEDIEKLNTVYGQIYEISIMVGQLIDRKQCFNLENFLDAKEELYKEAEELLKKIGKDADLSEFVDICSKIKEQEAMNISSLSLYRDEIKKEKKDTNKKSKLISAYSNVETKQGNLLDFRQ